MTSIIEIFETDPSGTHSVICDVPCCYGNTSVLVRCRLFFDVYAGCRYYSLLVRKDTPQGLITQIITAHGDKLLEYMGGCQIKSGGSSEKFYFFEMPPEGESLANVKIGVLGGESRRLRDLPHTGRVYIYTTYDLSDQEIAELRKIGQQHSLDIVHRGPDYIIQSDSIMAPKAFISHDSRDKDDIARPLAQEMHRNGIKVWFDEYSLSVGDSLRESIEKGLRECPFCILLLTPNFLGKGGWPKREYDSIFSREIIEDRNVMLPVWNDVTAQDVYEYSPILADRLALDWVTGVSDVAYSLRQKILAGM